MFCFTHPPCTCPNRYQSPMLALPLPFLSFVVCSEKSSCACFLLNAFTEVARGSSHRDRIQGFFLLHLVLALCFRMRVWRVKTVQSIYGGSGALTIRHRADRRSLFVARCVPTSLHAVCLVHIHCQQLVLCLSGVKTSRGQTKSGEGVCAPTGSSRADQRGTNRRQVWGSRPSDAQKTLSAYSASPPLPTSAAAQQSAEEAP
jgi:hypothetical protein